MFMWVERKGEKGEGSVFVLIYSRGAELRKVASAGFRFFVRFAVGQVWSRVLSPSRCLRVRVCILRVRVEGMGLCNSPWRSLKNQRGFQLCTWFFSIYSP